MPCLIRSKILCGKQLHSKLLCLNNECEARGFRDFFKGVKAIIAAFNGNPQM